MTLPTAHLRAGKYQPRTTFENIDVLVDSVRQFGLLQPILVRPVAGEPDAYEIIAGERRWRAAQKAQLHEVPVVIRSLDDLDALQLALVENLQRADLSPVDEAQGYRRLISDFNQTQEEIAHTMGKSRPHIANTLRLLDLPEAVRDMIRRDEISAGHGRALLAFPDPEAMAERVVAEKLSVRDLERLAAGERLKKTTGGKKARRSATKSADTRALEKRIEEALGLKVVAHRTRRREDRAHAGDRQLRPARHRRGTPDPALMSLERAAPVALDLLIRRELGRHPLPFRLQRIDIRAAARLLQGRGEIAQRRWRRRRAPRP